MGAIDMKSLQRIIIWNPVFFILLLLIPLSFVISYLIEKKNIELSTSSLEYIRDAKYKTLNKGIVVWVIKMKDRNRNRHRL